MISKKFLTGISTLIFILSATVAYAHGRYGDAAAFFFLKSAAMSVPQVIESVQKEEGGQVFSFRIEREEDNLLQYEMKILKDSKVFEAKVDPKSGKVLKTESKGVFSRLFGDRERQPLQAKLSLKDAISIVEKQYGGKALRGTFQGKSSIKMFRIRVANNEGAFTIMVDANTGELFRVLNQEGRNHDDEESDE